MIRRPVATDCNGPRRPDYDEVDVSEIALTHYRLTKQEEHDRKYGL